MYAWKSNPHGLGADRYPGESPDRADRDWRESPDRADRYRRESPNRADRYPNQDRYPVPVAVASMSAVVVAENWEDRVCWLFCFAFRP